jgi:hypothetical protein
MDFANAFPWISEMIYNFCKWILNFWKCISKNFANGFSILGNGFPRFWKCIFNFWKCIFNFWKCIFNFWKCIFLEMDFQFLEMHFQDQFLEIDFQFGEVFQCISLNLSNEFLIKNYIILIIFTFL